MSGATRSRRHPLRAAAPGMVTRLALALGLLAGLLAMHGLSTGHHAPTSSGAHGAMTQVDDAVAATTDEHPVDGAPVDGTPASDLADLCVAVLAGAAALAFLALRPLRPVTTTASTGRPGHRSRRVVRPPPRPPDLSVLCVLRT